MKFSGADNSANNLLPSSHHRPQTGVLSSICPDSAQWDKAIAAANAASQGLREATANVYASSNALYQSPSSPNERQLQLIWKQRLIERSLHLLKYMPAEDAERMNAQLDLMNVRLIITDSYNMNYDAVRKFALVDGPGSDAVVTAWFSNRADGGSANYWQERINELADLRTKKHASITRD